MYSQCTLYKYILINKAHNDVLLSRCIAALVQGNWHNWLLLCGL